jgi:predicted GNAT family acetyltransferase
VNVDRDIDARDNPEKRRFEATIEGHTAFVEYTRHGDTIWLTHTEVPHEIEGRGIGTALAKYALDYAELNALKVVPKCPFIADYIASHPQYADLIERHRSVPPKPPTTGD